MHSCLQITNDGGIKTASVSKKKTSSGNTNRREGRDVSHCTISTNMKYRRKNTGASRLEVGHGGNPTHDHDFTRKKLDEQGEPPRDPWTQSSPLWLLSRNQVRKAIYRVMAKRADGEVP